MTAVRFIKGPLGLLASEHAGRFEDEVVNAGDTGELIGPHPTLPDWQLVRVDIDGHERVCPCVADVHFVEAPSKAGAR